MTSKMLDQKSQMRDVMAELARDAGSTELLMLLVDPVWVLERRGYSFNDEMRGFLDSQRMTVKDPHVLAGIQLVKIRSGIDGKIPELRGGRITAKLYADRAPAKDTEPAGAGTPTDGTPTTAAETGEAKSSAMYNLALRFPLSLVKSTVMAAHGRNDNGFGGIPAEISAGGWNWYFRNPVLVPPSKPAPDADPLLGITMEFRGVKGTRNISGTMTVTGRLTLDLPGKTSLAGIVVTPQDIKTVALTKKSGNFTAQEILAANKAILGELQTTAPKLVVIPLLADPGDPDPGTVIVGSHLEWTLSGTRASLDVYVLDSGSFYKDAKAVHVVTSPSGGGIYMSSRDVAHRFRQGLGPVLPAVCDFQGQLLEEDYDGPIEVSADRPIIIEKVRLESFTADEMKFVSSSWKADLLHSGSNLNVVVTSLVQPHEVPGGINLMLKEEIDVDANTNCTEEMIWLLALAVVSAVAGPWGTVAGVFVSELRKGMIQSAANELAKLDKTELSKAIARHYRLPGGKAGDWAAFLISLYQMGMVLRETDQIIQIRPNNGKSACLPATSLYKSASYRVPNMYVLSEGTWMETLTCDMAFSVIPHKRDSELVFHFEKWALEYSDKVTVNLGSLETHTPAPWVRTIKTWRVTFIPLWTKEENGAKRLGPLHYEWYVDGKLASKSETFSLDVDVSGGDEVHMFHVKASDVFGEPFPSGSASIQFPQKVSNGADAMGNIADFNQHIQGVIGPNGFIPMGPEPHF